MQATLSTETLPLIAGADPTPVPTVWKPATRVAFRMALIYFLLFAFCDGNGSLFQPIPVIGDWIDGKLTWPLHRLAELAASHVFHLTGVGAKFHPTGSGDTSAMPL